MSTVENTPEAPVKVPIVLGRMFPEMLLVYAGWEGWNRDAVVFGLIIGVVYVVVYFRAHIVVYKVLERVRRGLLASLPSNALSRCFAHAVSLFLRLVFFDFLFLLLIWQTILLYVKVLKS